MKPSEWINRCARRYEKRARVPREVALRLAKQTFDAQEGEFIESEEYNPEDCADEEMDAWDG